MSIVEPPTGLLATVRRLGPGLIVAGSIVGSGELIATTKVGAEAGFVLLWLILIGCIIKVFTQVELGRSAIVRGATALQTLDDLPGPRWRAGWAVWLWVIMTLLTLAQQGGIVGGVGQALSMTQPLTEAGAQFHQLQDELVGIQVQLAMGPQMPSLADHLGRMQELRAEIDAIGPVHDAAIWATLLAVPTAVILVFGRFALIQSLATLFVCAFTIVTVLTVIMLQLQPTWAVRSEELLAGLSFDLPAGSTVAGATAPITTALAAFGIIGVGAAELVMYPYWCLEKGYARFAGTPDGSAAFVQRARGWMRVLQCDAWLSAVVYTFATVAFFLLGASVLGRIGLNPEKENLVRTLAQMYAPVFGSWATPVFLAGAFAVLYSTFFVASAGLARIAADCVIVLRLAPDTAAARLKWTRIFCGAMPMISLLVFLWVQAPVQLVLAGGIAQALMLPVLGFAALWSRYRRTPKQLTPGKVWDALLWLSCIGFFIAGVWAIVNRL